MKQIPQNLQNMSLDVIENHILPFLFLDESAQFTSAFPKIINLHREKMKRHADEILPLIDYHCVKATLKEMKRTGEAIGDRCCWDLSDKKRCLCARNRYVPFLFDVDRLCQHSKCKCISLPTIQICNPSTFLYSISRHLSNECQFMQLLRIIKSKLYKHNGSQLYDWLVSKKMNEKIFAHIPKFEGFTRKRKNFPL